MKKLFFLCGIFCCLALSSFAGITFNSPVVTNNSTITFTASGEGATNGYIVASTLSSYTITVAQLGGETDFSDYFYITGYSVTPYNCTTHTPTTITLIVHRYNIAPVDFDISFHYSMKIATTCGGTGGTPTDPAPTVRVFPYGVFGNTAISQNFTRNNCAVNYTGSTLLVNIAANTYASSVSQADADNQAHTAAQNYANANGTCTLQPVLFSVTNNSGNNLSITIKDAVTGVNYGGGVVSAHTTLSPKWSIPQSTYTVIISPAGMPVNCTMQFNTGEQYGPAPGHTFTGIVINPTHTTSLLAF